MEKFFLCGFFSGYELDIVDQKHVYIPVAVPEGIDQADVIAVSQRVDQLIGKDLGRNIADLSFRLIENDMMRDGVHQMRFAKSRSSVNKKGIVHLSGRFRYGDRGGVGKFVVASHDKGFESIFRIQSRFCKNHADFRILSGSLGLLHIHMPQTFFPGLILKDELNFIFCPGHLRDGHLEREQVFFCDVIDPHLSCRNKKNDRIVRHAVNSKRFQPGAEGNIGNLMFLHYIQKDLIPFLFDQVHKCLFLSAVRMLFGK